ncbi:MAG: MmgE/PrpD family protein [Betaproteobacteria bacterium]|nr:MmgE/PrpD family protein [Betaproteobacteria bacterium]
MELLDTLAEFAQSCRSRRLDKEVMHHAKRAVIDWYAALMPGAVVAPATLLEMALAEDLDRGGAHLALGRRATMRTAALINGTAAHAVEFDDIFKFGIYHPGAPTISAALAAAQQQNSSGEQFLRAVIAGYEISTRIGAAMGRAHYKYWHNTGTIGVFGSTPAVGLLLGLPRDQLTHAMATVTTFTAGLQQAFRMDSMSKPLHAGRAAEAGVLAALAAREGVIGSLDVIDGEAGFGVAMGDGPDWNKAVSTLGSVWHICMMTFKNHGCCGHTFASIDAALALQEKMRLKPADIKHVRVATYKAALDVADIREPRTAAEAKFSTAYVVANALVHGSVRLNAFDDERLQDPTTRSLMRKTDLVIDPELDATFPNQRAARVTIETNDGRKETFYQPNRKGDPELPLSDRDVDDKFIELAGPVIGSADAKAFVAKLWALEGIGDLAFTRSPTGRA